MPKSLANSGQNSTKIRIALGEKHIIAAGSRPFGLFGKGKKP